MPELEHDPELILRLAQVHEGNAISHLRMAEEQPTADEGSRSGWSQHDMLAASGFAIAASYWSLIAPGRAVLHYRRAAKIYRSLGHNYWIVLALASGSEDLIATIPYAIGETSSLSPQTVAFAMVGSEISGADRIKRLDESWRHIGNVPVGRLGIPLDHYGRCAQAMRDARVEGNVEHLLVGASAYINRAAEVLRSASHDRFHWKRLQSTVLPAEPEAVAMSTALSMMSHKLFDTPISQVPDLDAHGQRLVEIGDDMWAAAHGNDHLKA